VTQNSRISLNRFLASFTLAVVLAGSFALGTLSNALAAYRDPGIDGLLISQSLPPLQGRVMSAPAGTPMTATTTSQLSSEFARVGDRVTAVLGNDVAAGGAVLLPAGSQVEGQVVSVMRAGRTGKNGELDIRFTSATTPQGQRIPISARIQTEDGTGIIRGGTTARRVGTSVARAGVGAGLGAALGTAMGPLSGGGVGRGAIYGMILGSGVGALSAGVAKGKEAVMPSGQPIQLVLDQAMSVTPGFAPSYGGGYDTYQAPSSGYGQPNGYYTPQQNQVAPPQQPGGYNAGYPSQYNYGQ
jgi:hypothetical protein